jgi:tetratricopeptide (TPR) repeat protein
MQGSNSHLRAYVWLLAILIVIGLIAYAVTKLIGPNLPPSATQTYLKAAASAYNDNNFSASIEDADAILANDPNNVNALIAKATALAQEGSVTFQEQTYATQAIAVAQQALAIDPQNADAWRIIGYANEIMQNYPAAEAAYEKSLAIDPNDALTLSQQAHSYDLQGDIVKAEAGYKAALAIDPTLDQAEMGMGRIYSDMHNFSQALPLFEGVASSTQNARTRAEALYSAGAINTSEGNDALAMTLFTQSATADATYPLPLVGIAAEQFGQAIGASTTLSDADRANLLQISMTGLQQALKIDPNLTTAAYQAGIEMAAMGQQAQALELLDEAVRIEPQDISLSAAEKQAVQAQITAAKTYISQQQ